MSFFESLEPYFATSRGPQYSMQNLSPQVAERLAAFLKDNPHRPKIISGFRTPEHQADLLTNKIKQVLGPSAANRFAADVKELGPIEAGRQWEQQLRGAGITKWVALPGRSKHQTADAFDLDRSNKKAIEWAQANAQKYGFYFPMDWEDWHFQPVEARTRDLETKTRGLIEKAEAAGKRNPTTGPDTRTQYDFPYSTNNDFTDASLSAMRDRPPPPSMPQEEPPPPRNDLFAEIERIWGNEPPPVADRSPAVGLQEEVIGAPFNVQDRLNSLGSDLTSLGQLISGTYRPADMPMPPLPPDAALSGEDITWQIFNANNPNTFSQPPMERLLNYYNFFATPPQ